MDKMGGFSVNELIKISREIGKLRRIRVIDLSISRLGFISTNTHLK